MLTREWLELPAFEHPGDVRSHPVEDCPVCVELGDWAETDDSVEWIEAHRAYWEEHHGDPQP